MSSETQPNQNSIRQQAGILFSLKNILKTVAGQFPIASIATTMMDQIESHETGVRIETLESRIEEFVKLRTLEETSPKTPATFHDWSIPVGEYLQRTVEIAVAYDSGHYSPHDHGRELILPLAHACIIGDGEILTCKEAVEVACQVAHEKDGRVVILVGMAWYGVEFGPVNKTTGLCVSHLKERDEEKWRHFEETWRSHGLGEAEDTLVKTPVRFTPSPWLGQELGFIHAGEAEDVMHVPVSHSNLQFDTGVISHFRESSSDGLKICVTGVLGGRILKAGSPVFSRDGSLLGILSDTESYASDAGRRAVVRSLIGHPRFMGSLQKKTKPDVVR